MFKKLSAHLLSSARRARLAQQRSLPGSLLERAEASAGSDPQRAFELRRAALAYLGVVR